VNDEVPMRRSDVIHLITDALNLPRVGHVPGWIVGLMMGFPLVEAITSSIRMRNDLAKQQLGWTPRFPSFSDGLPGVLRDIQVGRVTTDR
jgi:hypothetical protein